VTDSVTEPEPPRLVGAGRRADVRADPSSYLVQAEITRVAFDSGPDAIIVVDTSGVIVAVNTQAELLTNQTRAELIGAQVETLVPEGVRETHREHRDAYLHMPYRRLMGAGRDLSIVQRTDHGEVALPVEVNLAPSVISIGTIVVATIRIRRGWGKPAA
jgi:PAS domain S-box-containing protein